MFCTQKYIYNKINRKFNLNSSANTNTKIKFKISNVKKIVGFNVRMILAIGKKKKLDRHYWEIIIESIGIVNSKKKKIILFNYKKLIENFDFNSVGKFIREIQQILSKLKFNKLTNKFEIIGPNEFDEKNINLTNYFPECVICYDRTINRTMCEHFVCLECWTKIKNNKCPVCRNKLKLK